ncbi:MAG: alginate export family protein [Methylococcaceae bacterium]|nr:alginate export family protein [Methylococcaceae bacterium]
MALKNILFRKRSIYLLIATHCFAGSNHVHATEPNKSYPSTPFAAFSSQMQDALLKHSQYEKPAWNLHDTLALPDWLSLSIDQRSRYESMDGTFKANSKGGDQQIPLQTTLWLQAKLGAFRIGTEFMDSRALHADSGSGVNANQADQADFLQGYVAWAEQNLGGSGLGAEVVAGRQTLLFGAGRLVSRNVFRNTINSFTGLRLRVLSDKHWQFNSFLTMPVLRYPNAAVNILNDVHQWDKEDTNTLFSGGVLELYNLAWGISSELYLYHLEEGDSVGNQTRNRHYFTPGVRFYSKPAKGKIDAQLETIGQFGTVRATNAITDDRNLDHTAWSQFFSLGYTFDTPWSPRLGVEYSYASGDNNPHDNTDQRFDQLYGDNGADFAPTGIYNAFVRTNINAPGYIITASPRANVKTTLKHRAFWLASASDSWGNTGLQDKTGQSGDFVGHQLEISTRWDFNSSLSFDTGWTHLFKGQFAAQAPLAPNAQDIDYFYVQSLLRF